MGIILDADVIIRGVIEPSRTSGGLERAGPWCSGALRSSARGELCQRARKANLASELAWPGICSRCRDELQPGADGVCDSCSAGLPNLVEQFLRILRAISIEPWLLHVGGCCSQTSQGRRDIRLADSSDFLAVCQRSDGPQTPQTMVSSDKS
jgi:hypothetical protein